MIIREKAHGGLGIRSMRQLNSAYLMKLGWRLKTEPSTLWARLLKEKYCQGRDWENIARRTASVSNAWRGIRESMSLTNKGMGLTIGNGRLTEFWNHVWLDKMKLSEHGRCPIPVEHQTRKVCDYWQPEHGWDWATLSSFLPAHILQRLASIELMNEEVGDQPVWKAGKSGAFTLRSVIQII